jgi:probable F420-dependent oxidoreductase
VTGSGRGRQRFRRMVELAYAAENAGFDSVWTGELYSRSAIVPMSVLADRTTSCLIGSGIAYGVGRSPLAWTVDARDLDELSEGRLILGLGNGTAGMMENWHGVSGESPAARMEELVELLRKLWRLHEGPVDHDGRFYRVHLRPTSEVPAPFSERLPIYTAGINDHMVQVAGRVADGLCGHPMFTTRYIDEIVRPRLEKGARDRGREPGEVAILREVICAVGPDPEIARDELAFAVAQYAASNVYRRLFELHGWTRHREAVVEAVRSRDRAAMRRALPEAVLAEFGIACQPGELADELATRALGMDHVVVVPPPWGLSQQETESRIVQLIGCALPVDQASRGRS